MRDFLFSLFSEELDSLSLEMPRLCLCYPVGSNVNGGLRMPERNDLSHHILPTSAQLIGVCLTVISLVKLLHLGQVGSLLDKLLAIDTVLFLVSAGLSYAAMRGVRSENLEKYADQFFILGLFGLGGCAILFAFELI